MTITAQMMRRDGHLEEFLQFWTPRPEIKRIWFSIFTPQRVDALPEILTATEREKAVGGMLALRKRFPKLDMQPKMIEADWTTMIQPCQFGCDPDCSSCGCIASAGLKAVADHKLGWLVPIEVLFRASITIRRLVFREARPAATLKANFQLLR